MVIGKLEEKNDGLGKQAGNEHKYMYIIITGAIIFFGFLCIVGIFIYLFYNNSLVVGISVVLYVIFAFLFFYMECNDKINLTTEES